MDGKLKTELLIDEELGRVGKGRRRENELMNIWKDRVERMEGWEGEVNEEKDECSEE